MGNFGDRQRGNQLTVNGENLVSADNRCDAARPVPAPLICHVLTDDATCNESRQPVLGAARSGRESAQINPFQSSHQTSQGNERAFHSCLRALRQALAAETAASIRIALAAVGCGCLTGNCVSLFPTTGSAQCRVRAGRRLARGRSAGCRSADRGHRGTPRSHHHGVVRTVYVEEQHVRGRSAVTTTPGCATPTRGW